jgi:hypothetical protein
VSSIAYVDTNGATQTLPASSYLVNGIRARPDHPSLRPVLALDAGSGGGGHGHLRRRPHDTVHGGCCRSDTLTAKGRTFVNGDVVRLKNSGGELPAGLAEDTDYYVVSASGARSSCRRRWAVPRST